METILGDYIGTTHSATTFPYCPQTEDAEALSRILQPEISKLSRTWLLSRNFIQDARRRHSTDLW